MQWESEPKTKSCGTGLVRTQTTSGFFHSGDADPNRAIETEFRMNRDAPAGLVAGAPFFGVCCGQGAGTGIVLGLRDHA